MDQPGRPGCHVWHQVWSGTPTAAWRGRQRLGRQRQGRTTCVVCVCVAAAVTVCGVGTGQTGRFVKGDRAGMDTVQGPLMVLMSCACIYTARRPAWGLVLNGLCREPHRPVLLPPHLAVIVSPGLITGGPPCICMPPGIRLTGKSRLLRSTTTRVSPTSAWMGGPGGRV